METINNGMCRCCASEGTFKDVKTKYVWMGEDEVYSQMLQECFDITLADLENEDGGICEVCITQLRNATNFKKQVLFTENKFRNLVKEKPFKGDIVKIEFKAADEDNDSDNNLSDGFSATDFDVPVKMESPDEPKAKKRPAKPSTSRVKKLKADEPETSKSDKRGRKSETTASDENKITLKRKFNFCTFISIKPQKTETQPARLTKQRKSTERETERARVTELDFHFDNIRSILINSNATPIRNKVGKHYACSYCLKQYIEPNRLKVHTLNTHVNEKPEFLGTRSLTRYLVELDITDLCCRVCDAPIESLDNLMSHLKSEHDENIHLDIKNHIIPYKFKGKGLKCAICEEVFEEYESLQDHMSVHYKNYVCEYCDFSFVNRIRMLDHKKAVHFI